MEGQGNQEAGNAAPIMTPGIKGKNSAYIKLISSDGYFFFLRRLFAEKCEVLMKMLEGTVSDENQENVVILHEIDGRILMDVCRYLAYYHRYTNAWYQIPEFPMKYENSFDMLLAGHFLKI